MNLRILGIKPGDGDGKIKEGGNEERVSSLPIRAGVVDTAVGMGGEERSRRKPEDERNRKKTRSGLSL